MELEYIANDGTRFSDPLLCQDYENNLKLRPGTVLRAKHDLSKLDPDYFIHGTLKVFHNSKSNYYLFATRCIDSELENYVNPEFLDEDKRYVSQRLSEVLTVLDRYDDEDECEYDILYADNRQFNNFFNTKTHNPDFWKLVNMNQKKGK